MINEDIKKYSSLIFNDIKNNCTFDIDCANNKISHSYILKCSDSLTRELFGMYFANQIINKDNDANIKSKIEKHIHSDVYFLPKKDEKLKVEDANKILESVNIYAMEQDSKVYVLNNFEDATPQMQNKLLKILEEPPQNVYFLLMFDNDNRVLTPIKSRCKKLFLGNLNDNVINEIIENYNLKEDQKIIIKFLGQNNLGKTLKIIEDKNIYTLFDLCINFLTNCKSSKEVLTYSSKLFTYKTSLSTFIEIYSLILSELGYYLSTNNYKTPRLASVFDKFVFDYTITGIINLQEKVLEYSKSLNSNCNTSLLVDAILLDNLQLRKRN